MNIGIPACGVARATNNAVVSRSQRSKHWMPGEERKVFNPTIQTPNVPCTLGNQVDEHSTVNEMIIKDEVVLVFDEWPVHVGHPIDQHQQHTEAGADTDHEADRVLAV